MRRPNVLFIISDQHNANCMGNAGHPDVRTPTLGRLVERGPADLYEDGTLRPDSDAATDDEFFRSHRAAPTLLIHKFFRKWSEVKSTYYD